MKLSEMLTGGPQLYTNLRGGGNFHLKYEDVFHPFPANIDGPSLTSSQVIIALCLLLLIVKAGLN